MCGGGREGGEGQTTLLKIANPRLVNLCDLFLLSLRIERSEAVAS